MSAAVTAPAEAVAGATEPPAVDGRPEFLAEVIALAGTETRLEHCIQCGTCGGSCPSAADMDHTPRAIFALIRAGMRDEVLRSNTPWMCVSCYFCAVRCPQEIHIPDVMYALKALATREDREPSRTAPDFSRTFVANIHRYGRSYEMGLVARHYLRHYPLRLPGMAPMGLGMVTKGRMGFRPHRIRGVAQLRAILDRASELESRA
ncbi:MAG TPA: 4Fe-4S dicluster domain-containing protein [Candidatus Dormibacteraeota bacterium]|nr:4Fe-4S dicluster domain-containing protein [Candidatus Dormibacteraeota bacterium]